MKQGIPARDTMTDQNGQITTIWLIFFENLYALYTETGEGQSAQLAQIQKIAEEAYQLASQADLQLNDQQKRITALYKSFSQLSDQTQRQNDAMAKQLKRSDENLNLALNNMQKVLNELKNKTEQNLQNIQEEMDKLLKQVSRMGDAPEDGLIYGRQDRNWVEVKAVKVSLPFFLTDGSRHFLALTSNFQLPFFLKDGTQSDLDTVTI